MERLDLPKPHGFLMWKGKKTAVLTTEKLGAGEQMEVCTGPESFGVVTLEKPVLMLVSEADRKEWFERHRVYPEEREQRWPGDVQFRVYEVAQFDPYPEIMKRDPTDESVMACEDQVEGEKQADDTEAENMPYEIEIRGDEHCVVNAETGETEKCHPTHEEALAHQQALQVEVVEEEEKQGDELSESALEIEKQVVDGFCVCPKCGAKTEHERGEPCASKECPECGTLMIREIDEKQTQFDDSEWDGSAANWPDTDTYCADCLIDANPEGEDKVQGLCKLPYRYPGEPPNRNAIRAMASGARGISAVKKPADVPEDRWSVLMTDAKERLRGWWPDAFESDVPESFKAGARVKKPMREKLREIADALLEILGWADYEDMVEELSLEDLFKGINAEEEANGLRVVKAADGEPVLVTWSSNAFIDRDGEIVSTEALDKWARAVWNREDKGAFNFWHIPGTDFARKEWAGVIGRFLVEYGSFDDTPMGRKALAFYQKFPRGHPEIAPEGWGASIEFRYLPEEKRTGVYDNVWIERTSTLPLRKAANIWTRGGIKMALTPEQEDALRIKFEEEADGILDAPEEETKTLEQAGIAHKEKEEPEEEAVEEKATEPESAGIDFEKLAAEMLKQIDVHIKPTEELTQAVKQVADAVEALSGRMDQMEKTDAVRKEVDTPRFALYLEKRASEAEATEVDEGDELLKQGPKETEPDGSTVGEQYLNSLRKAAQ